MRCIGNGCSAPCGRWGSRASPWGSPHPAHAVYPDWLRGVMAAYPHHVGGIDIAYIRLRGAWLYLVAILDGFSRYMVSGELSETFSLPFVQQAAERALAHREENRPRYAFSHDTARPRAGGRLCRYRYS